MTVPLRFRGVLPDHNVWSDLLVQWNPTGNVFSSKQDFFDDMCLWCLLQLAGDKNKTAVRCSISDGCFLYIPEAIYCFRPEAGLAGRPSLGTINVMMMKASVDIAPEMEKATIQPRLTATAAPIPPPKMEATALAAQKQP